ncbi:MAG: ATP-binding cassette domain-containing protein [Proteobacteria bacterium]|nr:ATP-binding cassette domain-containing protein [Pseudomonadota bacterium]
MSHAAVSAHNIWKVFGNRSREAMAAVREQGLSKQQILEQYNCVIGVADVSFEVQPGQIYCIMGLSGSGKSTLVRHINRLLEPSAGEIFVNQTNVMKIDTKALQAFRNKHIAMVFQNFALMPHRSVLDNIAMPLEIRGVNKNERLQIAEHNLQLVELTGWGNKFAHELSGGMQQRIGLARALASDPDILLMDEPFSALDPLIRRQLQSQFMALSAKMKKTTVFITHDLEEAVRIGDRIAIMRDGRIIQEDTPENIVLHPANEYIADFVAGISRLNIVRAHALMTPLQEFSAQHGTVGEGWQRFDESTPLNILIAAAAQDPQPLIITKADKAVGVVVYQDLLRAILADESLQQEADARV